LFKECFANDVIEASLSADDIHKLKREQKMFTKWCVRALNARWENLLWMRVKFI